MWFIKSHARVPMPSRALLASVLVAASAAASAESPRLIYLPSSESGVDHGAIVQALGAQGFQVVSVDSEGQDRLTYAKRVAKEIRGLLAQGVPATDINVVGAGTGSAVATLVSARVGDPDVNYVLLGRCDPILKSEYRFRMSGRVLGIQDDADTASHSCRALWSESPKVSDRQELVLHSSHGAALFHSPREQWMAPLVQWSGGGRVTVGEGARVTRVELRPRND
jgi:hypothetical protein